ncbi:hypothetical protein H5410_040038 [Solanum commersonii]|uniref:Uncharacterized protein n=1 Tax=Solanum commersonii TaxID=4109 RepID=A0A9J5XQ82_SOLCO|nr:hypothetical protein H5410_040038 [Solanum commersonii]
MIPQKLETIEIMTGHRTGIGPPNQNESVQDRTEMYWDEPDWNYCDGNSVPSIPLYTEADRLRQPCLNYQSRNPHMENGCPSSQPKYPQLGIYAEKLSNPSHSLGDLECVFQHL